MKIKRTNSFGLVPAALKIDYRHTTVQLFLRNENQFKWSATISVRYRRIPNDWDWTVITMAKSQTND